MEPSAFSDGVGCLDGPIPGEPEGWGFESRRIHIAACSELSLGGDCFAEGCSSELLEGVLFTET